MTRLRLLSSFIRRKNSKNIKFAYSVRLQDGEGVIEYM